MGQTIAIYVLTALVGLAIVGCLVHSKSISDLEQSMLSLDIRTNGKIAELLASVVKYVERVLKRCTLQESKIDTLESQIHELSAEVERLGGEDKRS